MSHQVPSSEPHHSVWTKAFKGKGLPRVLARTRRIQGVPHAR